MSNEEGAAFAKLSWDDVNAWAGSKIVSRGRSYQRRGAVHDLGVTSSGAVLGSVRGSALYVTAVECDEHGKLSSRCSCPYWTTCKHAVAVVLTYLDVLREKRPVPLVDDDERLRSLYPDASAQPGLAGDDEELDGDDDSSLVEYLRQRSHQELVEMISELAEQLPEVHRALHHRRRMERGDSSGLLVAVHKEISGIRSYREGRGGRWDDWGDDDDDVDWTRLNQLLQALLEGGKYDELMEVGSDLLAAGGERVEMEHEGESSWSIQEAMRPIFEAAARSSRPAVERMLYVVDMELRDDYGLCEESGSFWEHEFSSSDWSAFADELLVRLDQDTPTSASDFSARYRRDAVSNSAIFALEQAGRSEEIVPLCEHEARKTGSYERVVRRLEEAGRHEEAVAWIREGIANTAPKWAGIANRLQEKLLELSSEADDWPPVAAARAAEFFTHPSLSAYQKLLEAAGRAAVGDQVRQAVLGFLETGRRPDRAKGSGWPLPAPPFEVAEPRYPSSFPCTGVLVDIAIHEERPDDVLRWYRHKPSGGGWTPGHAGREDAIAAALKDAYPEESLAIWKRRAEHLISLTQVKSYGQAAVYLRKVRAYLAAHDRKQEWSAYRAELSRTHRRKRRFMEILDGLEGRPIIES